MPIPLLDEDMKPLNGVCRSDAFNLYLSFYSPQGSCMDCDLRGEDACEETDCESYVDFSDSLDEDWFISYYIKLRKRS